MQRTAALAIVGLLAATPVAAQNVCLAHGALTAHLGKAYLEQPASEGLGDGGMLFEVFVSRGGTWTLVATTPKGVSCIRATGKAWIRVPTAETVDRPIF